MSINRAFMLSKPTEDFESPELDSSARCQSIPGTIVLSWDISTFHNAAFNGKAEAARWCIDNGCPLDGVAPETAALGGNLPLLQMLVKERGLPLPTTISASVGERGHLEVLEWLQEMGAPMTDVCIAAATNDQLEVLKWAREHAGCEWDASCFEAAVRNGSWSMLVWMREAGCPWNERTCARSHAAIA